MKQAVKYAAIIVLASLVTWYLAGSSKKIADPMSEPPVDSGFATIMIDQRHAATVFAYKYGKGEKAKYQFIWYTEHMDTLKWKSTTTGKDTAQLVPKMGPDGRVVQDMSTPVIEQKYVLQWYPKPR